MANLSDDVGARPPVQVFGASAPEQDRIGTERADDDRDGDEFEEVAKVDDDLSLKP